MVRFPPADARRVSTHGELGALPLSPASRACPACATFKTPQRSRFPIQNSYAAADTARSLLEILGRRVVARINRVLEELVLLVGPELADVGIGLDHGVDVLAVLLLDLADIDVADDVAELVEPHRAAQGVRHFRLPQRLHEGLLVLGLAVDRLERVL